MNRQESGKETIIRSKLLPYFGDMRMNEITPKHVRHWQKQMIEYRDDNGEGYSKSYLATLHTQLSAIFNSVGACTPTEYIV